MENGSAHLACDISFNNIAIRIIWKIIDDDRIPPIAHIADHRGSGAGHGICLITLFAKDAWELA